MDSDRDGYSELHHAVTGLLEPSGGFLQAKAPGDSQCGRVSLAAAECS